MRNYSVLILSACMLAGFSGWSGADEHAVKLESAAKPRLVMVEVPSWKTAFFGLPKELPLFIKSGDRFDPAARHYDFSEGLSSMQMYIQIRPKDKSAENFRRFIKKWPIYQDFFRAIETEKYARAGELLAKIRIIDSQEAAVYFYQGSLNTQLKDYTQAEKDYRTCLDHYPDYGPAYINLARLIRARGDQEQSRKLLETAIARLKDTEQQDAYQLAQKMLQSLSAQ